MKKVAIVTAAGKGIGASCATVLHAKGYELALLSPSGSAEKLAHQFHGIGVTGSVTNEQDLRTLVEMTLERFGRIDVVVNNTGHPPKGDLLTISDADWHQGVDMMLLNVIRICRMVVPVMQKQRSGSIINISTAAAEEPNIKFPVSSVVRAGLGAFTKLFAEQYACDNIRMNNVLPGMVDTYPEVEEILKKIPMGRYASAQEIATTVAFLASDDSRYVTGQSLLVDGGLVKGF